MYIKPDESSKRNIIKAPRDTRRPGGGSSIARRFFDRIAAAILLAALLVTQAPIASLADGTAPVYATFYTVKKYTVSEGGNLAAPELYCRFEAGGDGAVPVPGIPVNPGGCAAFIGWYTAPQGDAGAVPFDFSITKDTSVFAHFRETYLVSFLDGKGNVFLTKNVKKDEAVPAPTTEEMAAFESGDGGVFEKWQNGDADFKFEGEDGANTIIADTTLKPSMKSSGHCYVFFYSEGSQVPFQSVASGSQATQPVPDPTREGYTFTGWKTKTGEDFSGSNFDFSSGTITADTTLYAQWTPQKVDYTIMLWNEKENIAAGDLQNTADYEYYGQYTTKTSPPGGMAKTDAGTEIGEESFKTAITAALTAAKTAAAGKTADKFNYLDTGDGGYFITSSTETLSGDGSTVVNVYLKRRTYTLEFNINHAGGTMTIGEKTYTSDGEKYTLTAKLGQDVATAWPIRDLASFNTVGAYNFQGWLSTDPKDNVAYSSKQLKLGSAIASTADTDGKIEMNGKWITGGTTITVHYMFERLPGETGGVRLGSKYYVQSGEYTQSVFSPASSAYNAKHIEGFTAVSPTAYRLNSNGTYTLISGTPPKDQYLFYNRDSKALIFVGADDTYTLTRRPGLNYESIMFGTELEGYEPVKPVKPDADGVTYAFEGWYSDAGFLQKFNFTGASMPAADLPVFAKWKTSQYTVSVYDYAGATETIGAYGRAKNERVGDPVEELGLPSEKYTVSDGVGTADSQKFNGWVVAVGPGLYMPLSPDIPVTGNMSVYASWKPAHTTCTVTYEKNGAPANWAPPKDSNKYLSDTAAIAKSPVSCAGADGKVFIGWTTTQDDAAVAYYPGAEIAITENVTLYPVFREAHNTSVKLTYDANFTAYGITGQTAPAHTPEEHITDDVVSVKSYAGAFGAAATPPPGYVFKGWSVVADGGDAPSAPGEPAYEPGEKYKITATATLYAQYDVVTVVYLSDKLSDLNDENGLSYSVPAGVNIGGDYTVLDYTDVGGNGSGWSVPAGYTFAGWYEPSRPLQSESQLHNAGEGKNNTVPITGMTTYLIAMYMKTGAKLVYNSNFPGNSGVTDVKLEESTSDVSLEVKGYKPAETWPDAPTVNGTRYKFIGWNTGAGGSGKWYQPGSGIYLLAETTKLYAQWAPIQKWVVTFIPTEYAASPAETSFVVDDKGSVSTTAGDVPIENPPAKENSGATFTGWEKVGDEAVYTTAEAAALPITENTTFIARWALLPDTPAPQYDIVPQVTITSVTKEYDGTAYHNPMTVTQGEAAPAEYDAKATVPVLLEAAGHFIVPLYSEGSADWQPGMDSRKDVAKNDKIQYIYVVSGADEPRQIKEDGNTFVKLTITPRKLAPLAYFPDINVGEPGPVFDGAYYGGKTENNGFVLGTSGGAGEIVESDKEGFDKKGIMLYTPYKAGDPAGVYGIYARAGYYDSCGSLAGEPADGYVDGGNYAIDGTDVIYLNAAGTADVNPGTDGAQKYVKIGSFRVGAVPYFPIENTPRKDEPEDKPPEVFTEEHIKYVYGYPDGLVKPENKLLRSEASAVFFRLLAEDYREGVLTHTNSFPDVAPGDWFNTGVSTLAEIGIVGGLPDGTFGPDRQITRAELAAMAVRFAAVMGETGGAEATFSDVAGHWAEREIYAAAAIGWVEGYPDGTFGPDNPITRAEFVTLVNRMLRRAPETPEDLLPEVMKIWPDNTPDKWYYIDIQEATNAHEYTRRDKRVPGRDFNYEKWTAVIDAPPAPPNEP
ncbi:MAG: InlB B-repeat-containing protein [Oscillospiraceae bacterium]|jgi:uncharacterized repeat protein (TIGR02543 family)|nr:InlB B-repeat-containing protein [Oscillospiraceae bacterium]